MESQAPSTVSPELSTHKKVLAFINLLVKELGLPIEISKQEVEDKNLKPVDIKCSTQLAARANKGYEVFILQAFDYVPTMTRGAKEKNTIFLYEEDMPILVDKIEKNPGTEKIKEKFKQLVREHFQAKFMVADNKQLIAAINEESFLKGNFLDYLIKRMQTFQITPEILKKILGKILPFIRNKNPLPFLGEDLNDISKNENILGKEFTYQIHKYFYEKGSASLKDEKENDWLNEDKSIHGRVISMLDRFRPAEAKFALDLIIAKVHKKHHKEDEFDIEIYDQYPKKGRGRNLLSAANVSHKTKSDEFTKGLNFGGSNFPVTFTIEHKDVGNVLLQLEREEKSLKTLQEKQLAQEETARKEKALQEEKEHVQKCEQEKNSFLGKLDSEKEYYHNLFKMASVQVAKCTTQTVNLTYEIFRDRVEKANTPGSWVTLKKYIAMLEEFYGNDIKRAMKASVVMQAILAMEAPGPAPVMLVRSMK